MDETSFNQDEPLHPKQWRSMTRQQRDALIDQIFVPYGRFDELSCELDALAAAARSQDDPGRRAAWGLAIVGPPGTGKTQLARRWVALATAQRQGAPVSKRIPYVFIDLPLLTTVKGISWQCLSVLGDPIADRGTSFSMEHRVKALMHMFAIHLLVVDQLDCLFEKERRRVQNTCVDLLMRIIQDTGISAVFLGEQQAVEAILSACPRLEGFVGTPRLLSPFPWDKQVPQTGEEFRTLMRSIDGELPLDDSGLVEEDMAYRIWYATDGTLRWIMALIRHAAMRAVATLCETLSWHLLAEAYDACIAATPIGQGKVNPFSR